MTITLTEAYDTCRWANESWRTTTLHEMRLAAMDQNVRDALTLPERSDAAQVREWLRPSPWPFRRRHPRARLRRIPVRPEPLPPPRRKPCQSAQKSDRKTLP